MSAWQDEEADKEIAEEVEELERNQRLRIVRSWAMPNKYTFAIEPIKYLVLEEMGNEKWLDPFAGMYSPATMTNDLNPEMPTTEHKDALEFLRMWQANSWDGVIFDPPYSPEQISRSYKNVGIAVTFKTTQSSFHAKVKDEIARVCKPGGKVVTCSWNSNGLGKSRGFEMLKILIVAHGGWHNDTIVTVERKVNNALF